MKPLFVKLTPAQELREKIRKEIEKRYPMEDIDEDLYENMISVEDFDGRYVGVVVDDSNVGRFMMASRMVSVAENSRMVVEVSDECSREVSILVDDYCDGHRVVRV